MSNSKEQSIRQSAQLDKAEIDTAIPTDSYSPLGDHVEDISREFGRYRVLRTLGRGAMGSVFLAEDAKLNRQVALKIPKFDSQAHDELTARFDREAKAAATLSHPNICPVFDVGEIDGRHFISMGYIEGRPLSDFINPQKLQPERQVITLVRKLALALDEAHQQGIIHRDVKPSNIMIDKRGEPIIMDFGLARSQAAPQDERLTRDGMIVGTPAYMPPEQVKGELDKIGPAADIYSLGVLLYEMLSGSLPFRGSMTEVLARVLRDPPPKLSDIRPDIDSRLESLCLSMLSKQIGDRPANMTELADALVKILKTPADQAQQSARDSGSPSPVASADGFDPYHKWLGIPPREQPPNHYRLLAIDLYETDADVIDSAAAGRLTHVRQFANSPNAAASQSILNEISNAQICLLNPEQKAAYDAQLKEAIQTEAEVKGDKRTKSANQADDPKLQKQIQNLEKQKTQIETLLEKCEFAAAVDLLEKVAAVKSPKLAKYAKWAKQQLPKAKRGTKEMRESSAAVLRTAEELFEHNNYEEAAEILQQIPKKFRTPESRELLQECLDLQEEIVSLQEDIDHAEALNKYQDLQPTVERLLEIKPADRRARRLLKELKAYGKGGSMRLGGRGDKRFDSAGSTFQSWMIIAPIFIAVLALGVWGATKLYTKYAKSPDLGETIASTAAADESIGDIENDHSSAGASKNVAGSAVPGIKVTNSPGTAAAQQSSVLDNVQSPAQRLQVFEGHSDFIEQVEISVDGKLVISASKDNTVRLWDIASGVQLIVATQHSKPIGFADDGATAMSYHDGHYHFWDTTTGNQKGTIRSDARGRLSKDGRTLILAPGLITGSNVNGHIVPESPRVELWDTTSFQRRTSIAVPGGFHAYAISQNGTRIVTGTEQNNRDAKFALWNTTNGNKLAEHLFSYAQPRLPRIYGIGYGTHDRATAFLPDDSVMTISAAQNQQSIIIWNPLTGTINNIFQDRDLITTSGLNLSRDAKLLALWRHNGVLFADFQNQKKAKIDLHSNYVTDVKFSADGTKIVTGSRDRLVAVWNKIDLTNPPANLTVEPLPAETISSRPPPKTNSPPTAANGPVIGTIPTDTPPQRNIPIPPEVNVEIVRILQGHTDTIDTMAVSPDGRLLLSGSRDRTTRLWDLQTGRELRRVPQSGKPVRFSPDGKFALTGDSSQTALHLWDVKTGVSKWSARHKVAPYTFGSAAEFSSDGKSIYLIADSGGGIRLVDAETGTLIREVKRSDGRKYDRISVAADNSMVLARTTLAQFGGGKKELAYDVWDGQLQKQLANHQLGRVGEVPVGTQKFLPDNRVVGALRKANALAIWDPLTGKVLENIDPTNSRKSGQDDAFLGLRVSRDGRLVASPGCLLWNLKAKRKIQVRADPTPGSHRVVEFLPDGLHAVSAGFGQIIILWKLPAAITSNSP